MTKSPPFKPIGLAALLVGVFLLLAPWTPPVVGVLGFVAVLVTGVSVHYLLSFATDLAFTTADNVLPEIPDEYAEYPVEGDVLTAYMNDEISEEELEQEIESALKEV